ncbi:MAG: GNAT family N-acetyltransferase [Chloroflexi bacterium]|nr:GNAT family N-acetyltransferase [Chloroflexota bacterium]MCI0726750.1 GNAT family N-acetyltransferase [Chloroflexota bacterium]
MIIKPSLAQASDTDLADAVQENLFALFRAMMVLPGGEIVEGEKVCYHHAFPSNPMFKGVWRTCLSPEEADEAIDQTLAWFQARQAPYVFWWVGPQTTPADLPERLQARGFTANMVGDPGMAADLRTLDETVRTPDGFTIVKAADKATLEAWRDVFCAAYDIPPFVGQAWVEATLTTGPASAPWQLYVGYWNEKPVACNVLFNGAGVAGVYGVGTIPEARGRGIGAAITLRPLLDARDQGYRYGVLFSTEMGYPVYQRLGFQEVPCKIGRYLLWN